VGPARRLDPDLAELAVLDRVVEYRSGDADGVGADMVVVRALRQELRSLTGDGRDEVLAQVSNVIDFDRGDLVLLAGYACPPCSEPA
jgi:hypothetical protein